MLKEKLSVLLLLTLPSLVWAAGTIGYSGRLVNPNGSPVAGPVDLQFDLAYSGTPSSIVCTQTISTVGLTNGVFHVKLAPTCTGSFTDYLSSIPAAQDAIIRVTNLSASPAKTYSFQALNSVPLSEVAKQLAPMGASNNEVLTWTGSKWEPKPTAATGGTVTEVVAGSGLSGGTINTSGTIAIANGGVTNTHLAGSIARSKLLNGTANYVLVNDGSGAVSEVAQLTIAQGGTGSNTAAGARTNLELGTAAVANIGYASGNALPADNIPTCLATTKLQYTGVGPTYWSCVADYDTTLDVTKLPLGGGTMSGAISMGTNKITNLGTPTVGTDAVTKDYVDNQFSTGANQWSQASGNVYRTSGNVGIGTSTPDSLLTLVGNPTGLNQFVGLSVHNQNVTAPAGSNSDLTSMSVSNLDGSSNLRRGSFVVLGQHYSGSYGSAGEVVLDASNYTSGMNFNNRSSAGAIRFSNASSELMRISQTGKVGIGSNAPTSSLQISGNITDKALSIDSKSTINGVGARAITMTPVLNTDGDGSGGISLTPKLEITANITNILYGNVFTPRMFTTSNSVTGTGRFAANLFRADTDATYTGNIANLSVVEINAPSKAGSGTIGNLYGLNISDMAGATTNYSIFQQGTDDINYFGGNVGIGTTTPAAKLHVNGTLLVKPSVNNGTTTIDFSTGNLQHTGSSCGAFALHNMKDGGTYTFAVKGATSTTCTFTSFTDAGVTPVTFHYPLGHGATVASKHTIYTFIVMGNDVYANWVPGL